MQPLTTVPSSSLLDESTRRATLEKRSRCPVGQPTKLYRELGIKVSYRHEDSGEAMISLVLAT